jgi:hypothetical protein
MHLDRGRDYLRSKLIDLVTLPDEPIALDAAEFLRQLFDRNLLIPPLGGKDRARLTALPPGGRLAELLAPLVM